MSERLHVSDAEAGRDMAQLSDAERLARAVILFFGGEPWTVENSATWLALIGVHDATSKDLCDLARRVRDREEAKR